MRPIDRLLERLDCVRRVGDDRWRARCRAHDSQGLSLSIAERDSRVLLHCFGGCSTDDVLASIGLTLADLFDKPVGEFKPLKRSPFRADDVLDLVSHEAMTLAIIASETTKDRHVSALNLARLMRAASRLNNLQSVLRDVR
jgi:hypothetical protein